MAAEADLLAILPNLGKKAQVLYYKHYFIVSETIPE